jgi:hypothetical protein
MHHFKISFFAKKYVFASKEYVATYSDFHLGVGFHPTTCFCKNAKNNKLDFITICLKQFLKICQF